MYYLCLAHRSNSDLRFSRSGKILEALQSKVKFSINLLPSQVTVPIYRNQVLSLGWNVMILIFVLLHPCEVSPETLLSILKVVVLLKCKNCMQGSHQKNQVYLLLEELYYFATFATLGVSTYNCYS